jgi:hypothetical protein
MEYVMKLHQVILEKYTDAFTAEKRIIKNDYIDKFKSDIDFNNLMLTILRKLYIRVTRKQSEYKTKKISPPSRNCSSVIVS